MRRLLAILLLATFGLPMAAPLLAQGQDIEQNLPICCRRNGAHHCNMGRMAQDNARTTINPICASYPQPSAIAPHISVAALITAQPLLKLPFATPSATARAETQRRLSLERTRQKRGPPAALLAA